MKKNNWNLILLSMIFAVSLIISNVVTAKTIETGIKLIGGMTISIPGAALCYAITFLMTDVIGEIWGKKEANKVVLFGFICQTIATLLIIFTQILPATNPDMQNAYNMLLGQNIIFVVGSLVAYFISQSWDVYIFHKIRDKYIAKHGSTAGGRWIWNNASTMTSQILDTVIFIGISFGLGFGWLWNNPIGLLNMFVGQYLVKFILAALDTPIFYLLTRERK
jgi:uncharacterized integral membrane protein (TIGR00697 family)